MTAFGIRGTFVDFIEDPWRHVGHESEAARFHADGLLVVEDGRIADFGAHDEVAARHVGLVVTTIGDRRRSAHPEAVWPQSDRQCRNPR